MFFFIHNLRVDDDRAYRNSMSSGLKLEFSSSPILLLLYLLMLYAFKYCNIIKMFIKYKILQHYQTIRHIN